MSDMKEVKDWMPKGVVYDNEGQQIFAEQENGHLQLICDIRGWGGLQQKFKTSEEAARFQDMVGHFIAQSINEKLGIPKISFERFKDTKLKKP